MVFYRKYKNFCIDLFKKELENESSNYNINNMEHDIFLRTFLKIIDKYAPLKKKYLNFKDQGSRKSNYNQIKMEV